mgnify:CR=1 FL=1
MMYIRYSLFFTLIIIFFNGCSNKVPKIEDRISNINTLIKENNLTKKVQKTQNFNLFTMQNIKDKQRCKEETLSIYIEGDGLSWITRSRVSNNPTPINPFALNLMLQDKTKCSIYIARPCQYTNSSICKRKYWTSNRFDTLVVASFNEALNNIKKSVNNKDFKLIGYSGGATVAAILSANRSDVTKLISVAGNLDPSYWTSYHKVSALKGLSPLMYIKKLENIKQIHFIGSKDKIVPFEVFSSYYKKFKNKDNIEFKVLEGYTHHKKWHENWKFLLNQISFSE